jgi:branched-chain amino acid transport system ATP-binding protein
VRALEVGALHAGYGSAEVLFGVDLAVGESEVLAMLGRNGMGKSTLIRTLLGHVRQRNGDMMMFV